MTLYRTTFKIEVDGETDEVAEDMVDAASPLAAAFTIGWVLGQEYDSDDATVELVSVVEDHQREGMIEMTDLITWTNNGSAGSPGRVGALRSPLFHVHYVGGMTNLPGTQPWRLDCALPGFTGWRNGFRRTTEAGAKAFAEQVLVAWLDKLGLGADSVVRDAARARHRPSEQKS